MSTYSTAQAARLLAIGRDTLHRWMRNKKVPVPRARRIAGVAVRIWTEKDVERARRYKEKFYRKGRGRKKNKA